MDSQLSRYYAWARLIFLPYTVDVYRLSFIHSLVDPAPEAQLKLHFTVLLGILNDGRYSP